MRGFGLRYVVAITLLSWGCVEENNTERASIGEDAAHGTSAMPQAGPPEMIGLQADDSLGVTSTDRENQQGSSVMPSLDDAEPGALPRSNEADDEGRTSQSGTNNSNATTSNTDSNPGTEARSDGSAIVDDDDVEANDDVSDVDTQATSTEDISHDDVTADDDSTSNTGDRDLSRIELCDNSCIWSRDGVCDDGGENALFSDCDLGADCADCGPREGGPSGRGCGDGPACSAAESCVNGSCVCVPQCDGRQCGGDGCGGICGDCRLGTADYRVTIAGGRQVEQTQTGQISSLEERIPGMSQPWSEIGRVTVGACEPRCKSGQACGSDGCGGQCGAGCGGDEACAQGICVGSGDVRVTLTWQTNADLDLYVTDPSGEEIYFGNREAASGGVLDVDAHAACHTGQDDEPGVENIFWPEGTAVRGEYQVQVSQFSACEVVTTPYTVTVLRNGRVEEYQNVFENRPHRDRDNVTTFSLTDDVCVPRCGSHVCGDDGCGGSCGACPDGQQCLTGICAGLGDLAVSLQWDTEHDLDLRVIGPDGTAIDWQHARPVSQTGNGQLDIDSHASCSGSVDDLGNATPGVENIFWPSGEAPDGEYIIYVSNWSSCQYEPEVLTCNVSSFTCE